MVRYAPHEDTHLDVHTDDSDVTFNVCLGKEFEGAGVRPPSGRLTLFYKAAPEDLSEPAQTEAHALWHMVVCICHPPGKVGGMGW